MFDISLYGHITFDRVFNIENGTSYYGVGSIGNVWKTLMEVNPKLSLSLIPTEFGESLILKSENTSERASISNLSKTIIQPEIKDSKWSHILYINELQNVSFIKDVKGIVSADICNGKIFKDMSLLKHIDFLFISDEDLNVDIKEFYTRVKIAVIYHKKNGSIVYLKSGKEIHTEVQLIPNLNVIGAGDGLVACFIDTYLQNNNIYKSIKAAHNKLTNILIKKNEN